MKFSILLPTHNRAEVLKFAIRSVLAQTETDWELLVVGDGCTDDTGKVVASFRDARIRWFDLPKGFGFGYDNRNVALRSCRGEYVAYAAHDDIWLPDHLALLVRCIEESHVELACSRPMWVEPGIVLLPGDFDLTDKGRLEVFLRRQLNGIPSSCVMHRRDCFERYGYWDASLPHSADWDMWARIIAGTGRAGYLPLPTCLHFRAAWRKESNVISKFTAYPGFHSAFPAFNLPSGGCDQEVVWRSIANDPAGWTASLRSSLEQADEWLRRKERDQVVAFEQSTRLLFGPCEYLIHAENDDPQLILPAFESRGCKRMLLGIDITAPALTVLQLFYATRETPHYTESQSVKREIHSLRNMVHLTLDAQEIIGALRLDPGSLPGDYLIHSVEVRGGM